MNAPAGPSPDEARAAAALFQAGRDEDVLPLATAFTQRYPAHGLGWMLLAASLKRLGRLQESVAPAERAIALLPGRPELHSNLGSTLYRLGREAEAEQCYRAALALQPHHADALFNLGRLQTKQARYAESAATFGLLAQLHPADGEAETERGIALAGQELWVEAQQSYERALALGHSSTVLHDHLARALLEQGRPEAALARQREALALKPDAPSLLGNALFIWSHVPGHGPSTTPGLPPEAAQYSAALAAQAGGGRAAWTGEAQPEVLRVGLVSGDLRRHPVASFLIGFIGHLAAQRVELHAYVTRPGEDAITARLKPHFAGWHSLYGLPAAEAAHQVAQDGMHVLFDLAGQSSGNRLDVFAHRPAPVQVTWLGVPASTGLDRMDFILTDPQASQPGDAPHFAEQLWPLPESWFSYAPLEPAPEVSALPALDAEADGRVTFGSFNSMTKVNDAVVRTWARVLQAVPGARLLLRNWQLSRPSMVRLTQQRFAAHGIAADRLLLEGPIVSLASHLQQYARVDIALDTFPYPGGTTSTEALFMGAPLLALRGDGRTLRLGESLLQAARLPHWIAADEDDYVRLAARYASDLPALAALRAELRPRLRATAFLDGEKFARQWAEAAWALWRQAGAPRRSG